MSDLSMADLAERRIELLVAVREHMLKVVEARNSLDWHQRQAAELSTMIDVIEVQMEAKGWQR